MRVLFCTSKLPGAAIIRAVPPSERALTLSQIAELEGMITPRRLREAVLGTDGGWLEGIDAKIATLRAKL